MDSPRTRLQAALQQADPGQAVYQLARALRDEGMTQIEMYRLFGEVLGTLQDDADETLHDAMVDTMDLIVGYCSPWKGLYPTRLEEAFSKVPLRTVPAPQPRARTEGESGDGAPARLPPVS